MAVPKAATNRAGKGAKSSRWMTRSEAKLGSRKRRRREGKTLAVLDVPRSDLWHP